MASEMIENGTPALILQLQLDDITAIQENTKGKEILGAESDADLAIELYRLELQNMEQCQADERLARSLATAVETDGEILGTYRDEERQAVEDHVLAQRLGEHGAGKRA